MKGQYISQRHCHFEHSTKMGFEPCFTTNSKFASGDNVKLQDHRFFIKTID